MRFQPEGDYLDNSSFPRKRNPGFIVTPVKTGVHPHPRHLDTVFQRYDEVPLHRQVMELTHR